MSTSLKLVKATLVSRLKAAGLDWSRLEKQASQIIVFGSYAFAANQATSDLDVLCIGVGQNYKSRRLHLIWISEAQTKSRRWLRSELATHVAAYGKWIKGKNDWAFVTKPSAFTLKRKQKNVLARLTAMQRHWDDLLPTFQQNQLTKLRRDVQRFQLMRRGLPPVPKPILDADWNLHLRSGGWGSLLANRTDVARRVSKFLHSRVTPKSTR
jgi:predicted nucleotidyltransferase